SQAGRPAICHGLAVPIPGRKLLLGMLGVLVVAVAAIALPSFACRPSDPKLRDLGVVPPFPLIVQRGPAVTDPAFARHVTIVSFVFTRCDTICPITTMKMQRIQEKTFDAGDRIELLSFSVDPAYDTPARLTEYAQRYRADPARWRFVTGPIADVHALIE